MEFLACVRVSDHIQPGYLKDATEYAPFGRARSVAVVVVDKGRVYPTFSQGLGQESIYLKNKL